MGHLAGFRLDGLVVVVAADQLVAGALPAWVVEQLEAQVRASDLVVLTKVDLVDDEHVDRAAARIGELAAEVPVIRSGHGRLAPGALGRFLALGGRRPGGVSVVPAPTLFDAHRIHTVTPPNGVDVAGLRAWLGSLPSVVDGRVVRAKGIVDTIDEGAVLVQVVGRRVEVEPVPAPEREPAGDLVVITLAD